MNRCAWHIRRAALVALLLASSLAQSHAGHDDRLKIRILRDQVHIELGLAPELLARFGSSPGVELKESELSSVQSSIERWLDDRLVVRSDAGDPVAPYFKDLIVQHESGALRLKLLRRFHVSSQTELVVDLDTRDFPREYLLVTPHGIRRGRLQKSGSIIELAEK